jgi:GH24 family phage-related lysozyme (muramidase)
VTAQSIQNALGYVPANQAQLDALVALVNNIISGAQPLSSATVNNNLSVGGAITARGDITGLTG